MGVNGAAAHKAEVGDKLIIAAYSPMEDPDIEFFIPCIVIVDDKNKLKKIK